MTYLPSPELPVSDEITIVSRRPPSEESEDSGWVVLTSVKKIESSLRLFPKCIHNFFLLMDEIKGIKLPNSSQLNCLQMGTFT